MAVYTPIILVDLEFTATYRFATQFYVDGSSNAYLPWLSEPPEISKELMDIYYGVEASSRVTLHFGNVDNGVNPTWATILSTEEPRGKWCEVSVIDVGAASPSATFQGRGKIIEWSLSDTELTIEVDFRNDEILETMLPKGVVTTDLFTATALDIGAPINVCLGRCKDVPLRNIKNDLVNLHYDYLIGYGVIDGLWVDHANGLGVKRDGRLASTVDYTAYDGSQASPYNGYAFIRFYHEQSDDALRFLTITADVKGLEQGDATANRDVADCIKGILSNTTWGLSESCDTTSFGTASTAYGTIGTMYCDGAITEQRPARDILNDLCFPYASLERATDGEWEISVDSAGTSAYTFGDNDGFYNNCTVTSRYSIPSDQSAKNLIVHYDMRRYVDSEQPYKEIKEVVRSTFGIDKFHELPFVIEDNAALKIVGYLEGRELYSSEWVELLVDLEGKLIDVGDIFTLTAPDVGISAQAYKTAGVTRDNEAYYRVVGWKYSGSIYTNTGGTPAPTPQTPPTTPVTGPQADATRWEKKTSDFTAESNHRYSVNTTAGGPNLIPGGGGIVDAAEVTAYWNSVNGATLSSVVGGLTGNCLKILMNSTANVAAFPDYFTVVPEATYTYSFYYKDIDGLGLTPGFWVYDITNSVLITPDWYNYFTGASSWTQKSYSFTTPASCVTLSVGVRHNAAVSSGQSYYFDTVSCVGLLTCKLPASPSDGDTVFFENPRSYWATNNFLINGNGNSIYYEAVSNTNLICDIDGISVGLMWDDDNSVWRVL